MIDMFLEFAEEIRQLRDRCRELELKNHNLSVEINGLKWKLKKKGKDE